MKEKKFFYIVVFSLIFLINLYFLVLISYKNINIFIFKQEVDALIVERQLDFLVPQSSDYEIKYTFNGDVYFSHFSSKAKHEIGEQIKVIVSSRNPEYFKNYDESYWLDPIILLLCCLVLVLVIVIIIKRPNILKKFGDSFPSS